MYQSRRPTSDRPPCVTVPSPHRHQSFFAGSYGIYIDRFSLGCIHEAGQETPHFLHNGLLMENVVLIHRILCKFPLEHDERASRPEYSMIRDHSLPNMSESHIHNI